MKIAFIHFYTLRLPRGIETLVISLANELAEMGHDVSILAAQSRTLPSVVVSERVRLKTFPTFRFFEHSTIQHFYARDLKKEQYDAVIVFFADFGEKVLVDLSKKIRSRIFAYWCYSYPEVAHRYESFRNSGLEAITSGHLADSKYVAEGVKAFFKVEAEVIPVGTDSEYYIPNQVLRENKRRELGYSPDDFVLLNVAALEKAKGAHLVVEALAELSANCSHIKYLVLGQGIEEQNLRRMVSEQGLGKSVKFAGVTNDLLPYYNCGDCFILLSEAEANSVAMHEAMSCGLPVIVPQTGGAPEVVDETCGLFVDRNRPDTIIEAIGKLASCRQLAVEMGNKGREKIRTCLTWRASAEKLLYTLEEACRKESGD